MTSSNCVRCNHLPGQEVYASPTTDALSSYIVYSNADRAEIASKTAELQLHVYWLEEERRKLEGILQEHQCLLAPVRRVPVELLSGIFLCADVDGPRASSGPLVVASVCRKWRDVAISTQTLWSSLRFDIEGMVSDGGKIPAIELVQLWLLRSGNCPLKIWWIHNSRINFDNPFGDSNLRDIFDTLISHRSRWQMVQFSLLPKQFNQLAAVGGPFPLLHTVDLSTRRGLSILDEPLRTFETAVYLKEVRLSNYMSPATCLLPWKIIQSYTSISSNRSPSSSLPITMSCLRDFKFFSRDFGQNHLTTMLNYLTAPSLQTLELGDVTSYGRSDPLFGPSVPLSVFLARSSCNLQRLKLHYLIITDITVIDALKLVPELADLEVEQYSPHVVMSDPVGDIVTAKFLKALTAHDTEHDCLDHPLLVPKLQRLQLRQFSRRTP